SRYRARIIASFMVAIPLANFIGSPLSGLILSLDGWLGLRGWHLLFIIEGLPAVLLGIAAWFVLRDRPHQANWLNAEQKKWLETTLETERQQQKYRTPDGGSCSSIVDLLWRGYAGACQRAPQ
ncbi:MAG: MFS transporter, partial [Enterobacter hormaechei]